MCPITGKTKQLKKKKLKEQKKKENVKKKQNNIQFPWTMCS